MLRLSAQSLHPIVPPFGECGRHGLFPAIPVSGAGDPNYFARAKNCNLARRWEAAERWWVIAHRHFGDDLDDIGLSDGVGAFVVQNSC